jgi:hypothetical protein
MKRTLWRGWMDGKSIRRNAEDDFSLRVKILRYSEKGCRFDLTTKGEEEPVQGAANGVFIL